MWANAASPSNCWPSLVLPRPGDWLGVRVGEGVADGEGVAEGDVPLPLQASTRSVTAVARSGSQGLGAATALLAAATPAAPPGTQAGTCCGAAQIHGLAAPPLLWRVGLGLVSQGEDEGADEEDDRSSRMRTAALETAPQLHPPRPQSRRHIHTPTQSSPSPASSLAPPITWPLPPRWPQRSSRARATTPCSSTAPQASVKHTFCKPSPSMRPARTTTRCT